MPEAKSPAEPGTRARAEPNIRLAPSQISCAPPPLLVSGAGAHTTCPGAAGGARELPLSGSVSRAEYSQRNAASPLPTRSHSRSRFLVFCRTWEDQSYGVNDHLKRPGANRSCL